MALLTLSLSSNPLSTVSPSSFSFLPHFLPLSPTAASCCFILAIRTVAWRNSSELLVSSVWTGSEVDSR